MQIQRRLLKKKILNFNVKDLYLISISVLIRLTIRQYIHTVSQKGIIEELPLLKKDNRVHMRIYAFLRMSHFLMKISLLTSDTASTEKFSEVYLR